MFMNITTHSLSIFVVAIVLSGCTTSNTIAVNEVKIRQQEFPSTFENARVYARSLSDKYLELSGRASNEANVVAVALIGSAATAAGGALYGSGLDVIKGAALTGATTNQLAGYFKPQATADGLVDAADQLVCINEAAGLAQEQAPTKDYPLKVKGKGGEMVQKKDDNGDPVFRTENFIDNDRQSISIILDAISKVKTVLRKKIRNERPDYAGLARQLRQSVEQEVDGLKAAGVGSVADFTKDMDKSTNDLDERKKALALIRDQLRTSVDECIIS